MTTGNLMLDVAITLGMVGYILGVYLFLRQYGDEQ
jgi:hypothetical protein